MAISDRAKERLNLMSPAASDVGLGDIIQDVQNARQRYRGNTINLCGDSNGGGLAWDSATQGVGANTWGTQFVAMSKGQVQHVWTSAISGQRTDQILARWDSDVTAKGAVLAAICCGTNDITQGIPIATILKNIEAMVLKCFPARITPILCTIPPRDSGSVKECLQLNTGLNKMALKYGLDVLDFYSLLVDPATGKFKTGMGLPDGLHPSNAGVKLMGQYAANQLLPKLPAFRVNLPVVNNDPNNLIKNGLFLTDTNADGVADNWTFDRTGVATSSIVTGDAGIVGNWMKLSKTGASDSKAYLHSITSGFKPGDRVKFVGQFKTVVEAGANMPVTIQLEFTGANKLVRPLNFWHLDNTGVFCTESVIPAGTTALTVMVVAGAGTGEAHISQMAVYNLTNEPY